MGVIYERKQQYSEAIIFYDKAIKICLQESKFYFNRAVSNVYLNRVEGSIQDFDMAINLNPYEGLYYFNRGLAYMMSNKQCGCLSRLEKGYKNGCRRIKGIYREILLMG